MLHVSKSAMLLAGSAVLAGSFATTADAQRRNRQAQEAPAEPERPQVSRAFAAAYQPVNAAITASDFAAADAALPALRAAATTPYELFVAAQTDFRIGSAQNNTARQLAALDAMIDSNGVPAADAPRIMVAAGQMAYNARDYGKAAQRFERAIALGSTADNLNILLLDSLLRANQLDQALTFARQQISAAQTAGRVAPEQIYSLTARGLQEGDRTPELLEMLTLRARAYPTAANLRSLGIIFLQNQPDNRGTTLDVMRVLLEANALDDRRYYVEYAGAAVEEGLPNEAITVVNAARAAGRAQASDTTFNEILASQNAKLAEDRASLAGSARRAREVAEARLATLTGDAFLTYGQFPQAIEMYELALTKANVDANMVNLRIGAARFRSGDMAGARRAFESVQGPRAMIAAMWLGLMAQREAAAAPAAPAAPAQPAG